MEDIICFGLILMQLGALVASVSRWRRILRAPFCADSWLSLTGRPAFAFGGAAPPQIRDILKARPWGFWLFGSEVALGLALALTLFVLFGDPSWRWVALAALSAHLGVGVWQASLAAEGALAEPARTAPPVATFDEPRPVFVRPRDYDPRERDFDDDGFLHDLAAWEKRRDAFLAQQKRTTEEPVGDDGPVVVSEPQAEMLAEPVIAIAAEAAERVEAPLEPVEAVPPIPALPLETGPAVLQPAERIVPPRVFDYAAAAAAFAAAVSGFGAGVPDAFDTPSLPAAPATAPRAHVKHEPEPIPPAEPVIPAAAMIAPAARHRQFSGKVAAATFATASLALACPRFAPVDDEAQPADDALDEASMPAPVIAATMSPPIAPATPARARATTSDPIRHGVVAAGHRITALAAEEILAEGGTAIDAALAAMMAACVAEPLLAGPAGGGFLMAHAPGEEPLVYDFFCATPAQRRAESEQDFREVHADFGPATQGFHIGAAAAAVPGFAAGLIGIHQERGTLPLARLAEPAIRAARDGVVVTAFQAYLLEVIRPIVTASQGACALFAPSGDVLTAGRTMANPGLADAFDGLAREGLVHFTTGPVGQAMIAQSADLGGHLRPNDLADYAVITRRPLFWALGQAELALNPSPAQSGPRIAMALALLERTQPSRLSALPAPAVIAEALAEADRAHARHAQSPLRLASTDIIAEHARALAQTLANHPGQTRGTTHISVMDAAGRAASVTLSNGEGNGLMVGPYGFMMNNMLGEADLNPGGFGRFQPRVRLASMMAPSLMAFADGALVALGSGGSSRIRSAVTQVAARLIAGEALEDVIAAPRVHVEGAEVVSFEDHFAEADRADLVAAWPDAHAWAHRNMFFGGVHAAMRTADGRLIAVADARRDGAVGQA